MFIVKLGAPKSFLAEQTGKKSAAILSALRTAFEQNLAPEPLPEADIERISVALPGDVHHRLMDLCAHTQQSPAIVSAQLINAVLKERSPTESSDKAVRTPFPVPLRTGQGEDFAALRDFLRPTAARAWYDMQEGKIAVVEAPTGSGKGRMIAQLAAMTWRAKGPKAKIVISAPLPITRQLLDELRFVAPDVPAMILLGRANFLDVERLRDVLDLEEAPELARWLEQGAPAISETGKFLANASGGDVAYLLEDALSLAPNEEIARIVSGCMLDAESNGPAQEIVQRLRAKGQNFEGILLVSHLYLAADQRLRDLHANRTLEKALLPERFDALLIDEAHLLEQAFSSAYSRTYHLNALLTRHLPALELKAEMRARVRCAIESLGDTICRLVAQEGGDVLCRLSEQKEMMARLQDVKDVLKEVPQPTRESKKSNKTRHRRYIKDFLADLCALLDGRLSVQLGVTPVRGFPVMTIGRSNLSRPLEALWARCDAAFLCSATIFLETMLGKSAKYFQWVMSLPQLRTRTYEVRVPWLSGAAKVLFDPTPMAPDDSDAWIEALATRIASIYENAKGGVVVLSTSFDTATRLGERLRPLLGEALIVQTPQQGASSCAQKYRERAQNGIRPLWIGLGGAWTGIDLSDNSVPSEEDRLLTDLIITRIPWRLNRSITHLRRMNALKDAERMETLRLFRQGIGRLVRREGVRDRKLHVLDPRIEEKYYASFRKTLQAFDRTTSASP